MVSAPAIVSAATMPIASAACASMSFAVTSPIAKMCGTLVRHRPSMPPAAPDDVLFCRRSYAGCWSLRRRLSIGQAGESGIYRAPTPPRRPFPAAQRCDTVVVAYDEELANRIRDIVQDELGLTEKRMFGGLAFLINGNMAVSASGQGGMLLRVDPTDTPSLVERPEASRFEMRGREMDGWLRIDPTGLATKRQLNSWVSLGVSYARSLPAK
jgi:hypothetical protein